MISLEYEAIAAVVAAIRCSKVTHEPRQTRAIHPLGSSPRPLESGSEPSRTVRHEICFPTKQVFVEQLEGKVEEVFVPKGEQSSKSRPTNQRANPLTRGIHKESVRAAGSNCTRVIFVFEEKRTFLIHLRLAWSVSGWSLQTSMAPAAWCRVRMRGRVRASRARDARPPESCHIRIQPRYENESKHLFAYCTGWQIRVRKRSVFRIALEIDWGGQIRVRFCIR